MGDLAEEADERRVEVDAQHPLTKIEGEKGVLIVMRTGRPEMKGALSGEKGAWIDEKGALNDETSRRRQTSAGSKLTRSIHSPPVCERVCECE